MNRIDTQSGSNDWSVPSYWPALSGAETHVWAVDVEVDAPRLEALEQLLSGDEIARANRFHFERDRARFVAARGQLRTILGRYANLAPASLRFAYSAFGKPSLSPSMGVERLRFNASGSDAIALVAARLDADVGIDIERIRSMPDALAISKRLLTVEEHNELTSLPEELRNTRFFQYWARKEALVKLLGKGLWQSLQSFSLHPWSAEHAQRVTIGQDGTTVTQWVIPITAPRKDFVAALATVAPIGALRCWTLDALLEQGRQLGR